MKKWQYVRRIFCFSGPAFALFFFSFNSLAVELVQTPSGVLIRALPAWEGVDALQVKTTDGKIIEAENVADRLQVLLSEQDLCKSPNYRTRKSADSHQYGDWVALGGNLCVDQRASEITLAFISDTQEHNDIHQKTAEALRELMDRIYKTRAVINGGDYIQDGTVDAWQTYRQIATQYTSAAPLVFVAGNHDYRNDADLRFPKLVYGVPETQNGFYYYIDFKKVVVIVLNSNVDQMSDTEISDQTEWLALTLEKFHGRKIIVTYHHPAWTSGLGWLFPAKNEKYARENWLPLFKSYGVTLVLNGHEHLYERLVVDGLNCLVAGPAAGKMPIPFPWTSGYSIFKLSGVRTITMITIRDSGSNSLRTFDSQNGDPVDDWNF